MQYLTKFTLKTFWNAVLKYKWQGIAILSLIVLGSCIKIITPIWYGKFFDVLASGTPDSVIPELITILFILAGLFAFDWVCVRGGSLLNVYFQPKIMADLSNQCFAYMHKHGFTFFQGNFVGSLVKRVNRFARSFEIIADSLTFNLSKLTVVIVGTLIVLFYKNIYLGLAVLAWLIVFLLVNYFFAKYKLKYDYARSTQESKTTGVLADSITNQANIKLFNGYEAEKGKYAYEQNELKKKRIFTWSLSTYSDGAQSAFMSVLEIGVMYIAIKLWQQGTLTIGDFVVIQSYLLSIFHRVWDFGKVIQRIYEALADATEMSEILVAPHEVVDVKNAKALEVANGEIEFKRVRFSYHKTREVLKGMNLVIKPNQKIALVGPSGAGKSTMVKLLMRVHDTTGGKIYIDGQKTSHVTQESLWRNISFVPQDPILFHRTLMENIRYGNPEATDEEVIAAAKKARCHEFIQNFPEGYETYVGERGVKLSGGERQRVAIARAILKNAPILVLDEATSSLDSESEHLIQDALEELMKDKTVLVIAHRLSTIMKMDRILVIKEGHVIEDGSHKQLLKKKTGVYSKLWKLQAGGFIA